ncbi:heparinase II/III family protein [Pelagibacteraceae bacterium]|nr:heparinase II/III family protein [Pelagibacteraceae bacterium]
MKTINKLIFIFITLSFLKTKKDISFSDLNFRKLDFTNYKQIKLFIFKKNFYKSYNRFVQSFEFLNFSKNLGGKIGINLSRISIIDWFKLNKNRIGFPWSEDLSSKRLINIIYNFDFINSSSSINETNYLKKIIFIHMQRVMFEYRYKNFNEITSYDLVANLLSNLILKKNCEKVISEIGHIVKNHIDTLGMHKSYNILEHAKYLNNLNELKNIVLYFNYQIPKNIEEYLIKMRSILNEYFHKDGSMPLFNGANNNYTEIIYNSLNKDEYLKTRTFSNSKNGIAFFSDKNKKLFFDVVQPNKNRISNNLSAGTLSFELSCLGEKIITNCGASESFGKNPEYLKYSAAHSTIIIQNTNISEIKENNPHVKFPQSVTFNSNSDNENTIFEGSHNGYLKKFNRIIKRKLNIKKNEIKIFGEDSIISIKNSEKKIIYHIRFHLVPGMVFNFTNNKKNIILKTKLNNMWLFKSDSELTVEDSIVVDKGITIQTKQIVIKGLALKQKHLKKWSIEKI